MAEELGLKFFADVRGAVAGMETLSRAWTKFVRTIQKVPTTPAVVKVDALQRFKKVTDEVVVGGSRLAKLSEVFKRLGIAISQNMGAKTRANVAGLRRELRGFNADVMKTARNVAKANIGGLFKKGWGLATGAVQAFTKFMGFIPRIINMVRSRILSWTASIFAVYFAFGRLISGIKEFSLEMRSTKIIADASGEEMEMLKGHIFKLAETFPTATLEIAKTAHVIADYGLSVKEMQPYLKETIKISSIFRESTERVADVLYAASINFREAGKTVEDYAAIIYGASTTGILNLKKFTDAFIYTSEAARLLNFTFKDLALIITLASERILRGSKVGTGLRRILVQLAKIAGTTEGEVMTLENALDILGITGDRIREIFRAGGDEYARARGLIELLSDAIEGNIDKTKALAAISKVFNLRATELAAGLADMKDKFEEHRIAMENNIVLYKQLEATTRTVGPAMQVLENIILRMRIALVTGLSEPFADFVETIRSIVLPAIGPLIEAIGIKLGQAIINVSKWLEGIDWANVQKWLFKIWAAVEKLAVGIGKALKNIATVQIGGLLAALDQIPVSLQTIGEGATVFALLEQTVWPWVKGLLAAVVVMGQLIISLKILNRLSAIAIGTGAAGAAGAAGAGGGILAGLGRAARWIPGVGVVAGLGYLAYQYFKPDATTAKAPEIAGDVSVQMQGPWNITLGNVKEVADQIAQQLDEKIGQRVEEMIPKDVFISAEESWRRTHLEEGAR